MPFGLKRLNQVEGVQAHGAIRATVHAQIALTIALNACRASGRAVPRKLRYASVGNVQRMDSPTKVHELGLDRAHFATTSVDA